jgi:hypothetical protein
MIPDNGRHEANFVHRQPDGSTWSEGRPVLAWSQNGDALILHQDALAIACNLPGFKCIREADPAVIGVIGGGGWRIERRWDDGTITDAPVVGWALRSDGEVGALETDATGTAEEVGSVWADHNCVIYHPSETPQTHRLANRDEKPENGTTT